MFLKPNLNYWSDTLTVVRCVDFVYRNVGHSCALSTLPPTCCCIVCKQISNSHAPNLFDALQFKAQPNRAKSIAAKQPAQATLINVILLNYFFLLLFLRNNNKKASSPGSDFLVRERTPKRHNREFVKNSIQNINLKKYYLLLKWKILFAHKYL